MSTDKNTGPDQSDSSVTARENLSLVSIDGHRHATVPFEMIQATCFASRAGHTSFTVYRFITALAMTDNLRRPGMWGHVLKTVADLVEQERLERNPTP